jgi:protoheme IX farnesyltransferase
MGKLKSVVELLKLRLSFLVIFSSAFGFVLASKGEIDFIKLSYLLIGGLLITGASNILNQIIEKDLDKLMKRTQNRPLPTYRLSINEAITVCIILTAIGFGILISRVNVYSAFLTLISLILYAFVYTPMKRLSPFAVFIGAFPGAMPPLIGWVGYSNSIGLEAITIFCLQFIWQFPHFWAIAWVLHDDYAKAGFNLLPSSGGKNINTAVQIMVYTLFLIPISLLPTIFGIVGWTAGIVSVILGVLFLLQSFYLIKVGTDKAAKQIMFGSFIYLPVVQIVLMLDKL